mmetsp:Transcript_35247/g.80477  ORF Transcript_35247/g.80477 Transcript_35247/m.80477 type:complete len:361 (-) Transcript_35247:261-1343(-)|eukprot:CAMPEP_0114543946 /NCGR_PEP_ID=MMETSP0114-20121206/2621_1 /TAXON_ID=31324 /ORGANISM="Goniomonas sp, Strain m" /LENGTH=360 /DNA_ID=CAMNT_0001728307 /DNA_START=42 /DNA_END=1124 /DNA_ORIENTATION=-
MDTLPKLEFAVIVCGGTVLSINAGFVNSFFLSGPGRATVSHVTGTVTKLGVDIQDGETDAALYELLRVSSFILGAFLCAILVGGEKFNLKKPYGLALLIISACLFASYLVHDVNQHTSQLLAAIACGMQNSLTTVYSGAVLRTTHMTGVATDIGHLLGMVVVSTFSTNVLKRPTKHDPGLWKLKIFCSLLFGFLAGSVAGSAAQRRLGNDALLFPVGFTFISGVTYFLFRLYVVKGARVKALLRRRKHLELSSAVLTEASRMIMEHPEIIGGVELDVRRDSAAGVGGASPHEGPKRERLDSLRRERIDSLTLIDDGADAQVHAAAVQLLRNHSLDLTDLITASVGQDKQSLLSVDEKGVV